MIQMNATAFAFLCIFAFIGANAFLVIFGAAIIALLKKK